MNKQLSTSLNNGNQMPLLGLGVYDMHAEEAVQAVRFALQTGYRLIDTAAMYENEKQIGEGIRTSGISRDEIFLTTKVNNPDQGYDQTLKAFDESLKKLNTDYIDLYLIHWPIKGKRKETWKAIENLYLKLFTSFFERTRRVLQYCPCCQSNGIQSISFFRE